MKIISHGIVETLKTGRIIAKNLKKGDVICLFGELGAGKTVLVKGIAQGLKIKKDKIISPTFVLLRQYLKSRIPLYHFDLYRLKDPRDIFNLGYEEYFYGDGITVIEWADRLRYPLLPKEYLKISLEIKGEKKRKIEIVPSGKRYKDLLEGISENLRH